MHRNPRTLPSPPPAPQKKDTKIAVSNSERKLGKCRKKIPSKNSVWAYSGVECERDARRRRTSGDAGDPFVASIRRRRRRRTARTTFIKRHRPRWCHRFSLRPAGAVAVRAAFSSRARGGWRTPRANVHDTRGQLGSIQSFDLGKY